MSVQFSRESVCLITNLAFVFLYPIVNNFDVKFEANFRGVHFIANMTLIGMVRAALVVVGMEFDDSSNIIVEPLYYIDEYLITIDFNAF